jgi:hypothetical protein
MHVVIAFYVPLHRDVTPFLRVLTPFFRVLGVGLVVVEVVSAVIGSVGHQRLKKMKKMGQKKGIKIRNEKKG